MNASLFLRILLLPLSVVYGVFVRLRVWLYTSGWLKQKRLKGTVISIGNLTVGGTGKTPMVIWLAEKFLADGKRVAILSRGYRGTNGTSDEIEVMKFRLRGRTSFGVGADRFAEGHSLESREPIDVFLLDDGFQHLKLARDLDILLMDASRPLHGESLLPAGPLREPVTAMRRANVVVFTRTETMPGTNEAISKLTQFPVFAAATKLLGFRRLGGDIHLNQLEEIGTGPFFAFCGLGNPYAFLSDLRNWGVALCGHAVYSDHHRYTAHDISEIKEVARQAGANALVTTEKDEQNLQGKQFEDIPVYVSVIGLSVSPQADFANIVDQVCGAKSGSPL